MRIIPRKSIAVFFKEFKAAVKSLCEGGLLTGQEICLFEKLFADYIGVKYALAVSSARIGIWTVLKALECSQGDKVILSSYNFPVIPSIVDYLGGIPVFADINPSTYNINFKKIEERIDDKTKYILVTHMFGQPCDLDPIIKIAEKYKLKIIEDCAHACGSRYKGQRVGSFGEAGCFSFGIGKSLVTFGGGMITTNNEELYRKIKEITSAFRLPGRWEVLKNIILGFVFALFTKRLPFAVFVQPVNFICNIFGHDLEEILDKLENKEISPEHHKIKFANIQAVIGIEQLKKIESINRLKRKNSGLLSEKLRFLKNIEIPIVIEDAEHSCLYYPVKLDDTKEFKKYLIRNGIDVKLSTQQACSVLKDSSGDTKCIFAERINNKILELPNLYNLNINDINYMVKQIDKFLQDGIQKIQKNF